ncbi:polymer-forming cytoskeletal protein [Flavobacterium sp. '19STA2R22 D10 B1']|uniref:polymer-forming cytoskeletal protein n=1 Tax=Flavobacterium aerium TaxID=3037261 RepID=UPI00278C159A|nr:polymer-forming cytoskeletal protein [Flavobacterium sp. '19STA2R22 D10 B1']
MSEFRLLHFLEVKNKYPFLDELEGFDYFDDWDEQDYLLVAEDDVVVNSHLILDVFKEGQTEKLFKLLQVKETKQFSGRIQGIIVLGDLTVHGSIINEIGDYGPFIYNKGNVQCQSLLLGGSYAELKGNCIAKEVVLCDYNHGTFKCEGTITAPVFIVNDHHTIFGNKEISLFYYNDKGTDSHSEENECGENDEGDWTISSVLTQHLSSTLTTTFEELQRDLAKGEWVLQTSEKTIRDYQYWTEKVNKNYRDLKRVPFDYKDEALCNKALNQTFYALPYCKEEYITEALCISLVQKDGLALRVIPAQFITEKLCILAADKGTILNLIPERYYTEELILKAMKNRSYEPNIQEVPEAFITKNLLVEYVKMGKGLFLDKICKEKAIDKIEILKAVVDEDIKSLDLIFSHHCSAEMIEYALQYYDTDLNKEKLNQYLEKYKTKLSRYK